MKKLLIITLLLCFALPSLAQTPRFEDYPIKSTYKGKLHPAIITKQTRSYRSRLQYAAMHNRPNFAGHYILTFWGCGAECRAGAIIDAATGKVFPLPFTVCCWFANDEYESMGDVEPIEFKLNSDMIIIRGARNEEGQGTYFYRFTNGRLAALAAIESKKISQ